MINTEVIKKVIDEHYNSSREELESKILEAIKYEEIENYGIKSIWDLDTDSNAEYYQLTSMGDIANRCFSDVYDVYLRSMGNAFLTKEEAEFERERRKIEAIMRRYSRPFRKSGDIYYKDSYYIEFDIESRELKVKTSYRYSLGFPYRYSLGVPYFETEEIAQKVIDEIGEDRLKKHWFQV